MTQTEANIYMGEHKDYPMDRHELDCLHFRLPALLEKMQMGSERERAEMV